MFSHPGDTTIYNSGANCTFNVNHSTVNVTPGGPQLSPEPDTDEKSHQQLQQQTLQHLLDHTGTFWNTAYPKSTNVAVLNELTTVLNDFKDKIQANTPEFQEYCNAINMKITTKLTAMTPTTSSINSIIW